MAKTNKKTGTETKVESRQYEYFFSAWLFKEGEDAKVVDGVYEALHKLEDSTTINNMKEDIKKYFAADGIALNNFKLLGE